MPSGLLPQVDESNLLCSKLSRIENYGWGEYGTNVDVSHSDDMQDDGVFGMDPFYIKKGNSIYSYFYMVFSAWIRITNEYIFTFIYLCVFKLS